MAMSYGNVYVASVAMGAKDEHTLKAFLEAEAYDGPSLIIAYSHCIAHGIEMTTRMCGPESGGGTGQWLLYRYNPERALQGENPLTLDSRTPTRKVQEFLQMETRFKMLTKSKPEDAKRAVGKKRSTMSDRAISTSTSTWRSESRILNRGSTSATCEASFERSKGEPLLATRGQRFKHLRRRRMIDLTTKYLGLNLRTPLVASASPLSQELDGIRRLEDAGASAIVLYSLFEEQLRQEVTGTG